MASRKAYNAIDLREQLIFIEIKKGEFAGYKQDWLISSLNEVEKEFYVCTKCNGLMRNACQIGDEQIQVCDVCTGKGEKPHPMVKFRKKILELRVECPLKGRGCEWNGTIAEMDAHLDVCTEFIVNCTNKCDVIMKRSELINHCKNECQNRIVNCEHCKLKMQYKKLGNHLKTCPEFPLLCPNECMKNLTRKKVKSHVEKECPNTLLNCTNNCGIQLKRSKMQNHCENECQNREMNCTYCKAVFLFKEIEIHNKTCPEFPLLCPNECLKKLRRKQIESHIETDCPNTIVECPYKNMGCDAVMKRCDTEEHEKKFESNHLKLTINRMEQIEKNLQTQERRNELKIQSQEKSYDLKIQSQEKSYDLKIQTQERNYDLKIQSQEISYELKIEKLKTEIDYLKTNGQKLETLLKAMDRKVEYLTENLTFPVLLRSVIKGEMIKTIIEEGDRHNIFKYLMKILEYQKDVMPPPPPPPLRPPPIMLYEGAFAWNDRRLSLTLKYEMEQELIIARISKHSPLSISIPVTIPVNFKLKIIDTKNIYKSIEFPIHTTGTSVKFPKDLILNERFRNEDNSISLQIQDMQDSQ